MLILGIETSCDETAAAIVSDDRCIVSNVVLSQWREHMPYGGVVPEIAARAHIKHLEAVIQEALRAAKLALHDMDAIAVTAGPGLIGGVIVGVMTAKGIASALGKPIVAVNHLEGHALTARLTDDVAFPYLLLLASGGHCQFISVEGVGRYTRLGGTLDDALGEAYDKVAKMLGLGMPGGPAVEKLAREGRPRAHAFSIPLHGREGCDMSFSGLKTAVRMAVEKLSLPHRGRVGVGATMNDVANNAPHLTSSLQEEEMANICASFQYTAAESVAERLANAIKLQKSKTLVMAGGVAANQYLRMRLKSVAEAHGMRLVVPPAPLCTDNAAMIAWAGIERLRIGQADGLEFEPRARWGLE